ncbi:CRISPR-associated protein [Anaerostipes sp.]|uniref:CRISPR-associated protein n=1 Tax=Anaerostipes sp. TaxID=1872530 RepID=UPI0025C3CB91|nr:CRISPR-associated protein [Anaerostipes sp.]
MLKECTEIFREELRKNNNLLFDFYIPANGTYLIVKEDGTLSEPVEIELDKKTGEINRTNRFFAQICQYDYYSRLIDMNKPQDNKKIIHSNNYLSFFVKKESLQNGKLNMEAIDRYFDAVSHPELKYKGQTLKIYQKLEEDIGEIPLYTADQYRQWIKDHIFKLDVDLSKKDYLKIFFEAPMEQYKRENDRYLVPNIYNSNDYNLEIEEQIYGLPNNNLGMNAKKTYLSSRTKKTEVPFLLNKEEVLMQKKFFDHLMNYAMVGKSNVYVDTEERTIRAYKNKEMIDRNFNGVYLRIQKGKEVEIHSSDIISCYHPSVNKPFKYRNALGYTPKEHKEGTEYGTFYKKEKIQTLLDVVFFSKFLAGNYFTPQDKLGMNDGYIKRNLIHAREAIFDWLYKDETAHAAKVLKRVSLDLVLGALEEGYIFKAMDCFNLRHSLLEYFSDKEEDTMGSRIDQIVADLKTKLEAKETQNIQSDGEYFFAVGQLVQYYISLNKGKRKTHALANPFLNAKTDAMLKEKLVQFFKKYNYEIDIWSKHFNQLYCMITEYEPEGKIQQDLMIAGYLHSSLIYVSKEDK